MLLVHSSMFVQAGGALSHSPSAPQVVVEAVEVAVPISVEAAVLEVS